MGCLLFSETPLFYFCYRCCFISIKLAILFRVKIHFFMLDDDLKNAYMYMRYDDLQVFSNLFSSVASAVTSAIKFLKKTLIW
jgi:hypothetical protein